MPCCIPLTARARHIERFLSQPSPFLSFPTSFLIPPGYALVHPFQIMPCSISISLCPLRYALLYANQGLRCCIPITLCPLGYDRVTFCSRCRHDMNSTFGRDICSSFKCGLNSRCSRDISFRFTCGLDSRCNHDNNSRFTCDISPDLDVTLFPVKKCNNQKVYLLLSNPLLVHPRKNKGWIHYHPFSKSS